MIKANYIGPKANLKNHQALVSKQADGSIWVQFDEYGLDKDIEYALSQHEFPADHFQILPSKEWEE